MIWSNPWTYSIRSVGNSYHSGSSWKSHVRSCLHHHVSVHNGALPHSRTVSQQHVTCFPAVSGSTGLILTSRLWWFRQNGLGYTAFMARLGVSVSPLVMLLEDAWRLLPAVTYCVVAVGSGIVASFLPETLNTCLPEFIEDIEKRR